MNLVLGSLNGGLGPVRDLDYVNAVLGSYAGFYIYVNWVLGTLTGFTYINRGTAFTYVNPHSDGIYIRQLHVVPIHLQDTCIKDSNNHNNHYTLSKFTFVDACII